MTERPAWKRSSGWTALVLLASAALGGLSSCEPVDGGARQTFAGLTTCPSDESTVVPRPDYRIPAPPVTSPPPEIAADPARLADWQRRDQEARHLNEVTPCGAALPGFEAFEVTGCGKDVLLCCAHSPAPGGPNAGADSCVQEPMAGGAPPIGRGAHAPPPPSASAAPPVAAPASSAGIAL
jgi:hypothetical protein